MADYPSIVIADGASAYWRLQEASGATAVDQVGGFNGAITSMGSYRVPGPFAGMYAMRFNGTSSRINVSTAAYQTFGTGPLTVECWARIATDTGAGQIFLDMRNSGGTAAPGPRLSLVAGLSRVQGVLRDAGAVDSNSLLDVPGIIGGGWNHIAGVLTRGPDRWTVYVNGVPGSVISVSAGVSVTSTSGTVLGATGGGAGQWLSGDLAEVAVYPVALTPTQIAAHYAAALASMTALAPVFNGRQYLLGTPMASVSTGTGPWVPVACGFSRLTVTTVGLGTIIGGTLQLEETDDPHDGSGATPAALGAPITLTGVSGNKKLCTHLGPGAYGFLRARLSADVVGGGSIYASLVGVP